MADQTNGNHQTADDHTDPTPEERLEYLRILDDQEGYQPLGSVDIVWNNLNGRSEFSILRFKSSDSIETLLVRLGRSIEAGPFENVYNVSASRFALFITVATTKSVEELGRNVWLGE